MFATFHTDRELPVVGTAIHNGHDLRPSLAELIAIDERTRLREEDPFTSNFIESFPTRVIANHSRFEVDLNRPRSEAVYVTPDDAWGLNLWKGDLSEAEVGESLRLHDRFYADLAGVLDRLVEDHGGFVLYDVHSYNHRRNGSDQPPESPADNPLVNLGTGSLPDKWAGVASSFLHAMRSAELQGQPIDARENVKFRGRQMAAFVHERYGERACALAIEFRKDFMDEWTGELYPGRQKDLATALVDTIDPVVEAWERARAGK